MNYDEYKEAYNALNLTGDRLLKGALSLGTEYREFTREPNISEAGDVLCAIMLIDTHYNFGFDFKKYNLGQIHFDDIFDIQELIKKYEYTKEAYRLMSLRHCLLNFTDRFHNRTLEIAPLSEIFEYNINKLKTRI
jgi:hypothetical protein